MFFLLSYSNRIDKSNRYDLSRGKDAPTAELKKLFTVYRLIVVIGGCVLFVRRGCPYSGSLWR